MKGPCTVFALLVAAAGACAQSTGSAGDAPADAVAPPPAEFVVCPEPGGSNGTTCASAMTPVCAALDNGIRCVTTPCDNTDWQSFDDACEACATPGAIGYRDGAC